MATTLWFLSLLPLAALVHLGGQANKRPWSMKRLSGQQILDVLCALALRIVHLVFAIHRSFQMWVQRSLTQAEFDVQELLQGEDTDELADKRQNLADFLASLPQRPENFAVVLPELHECVELKESLLCDIDSVETLCAWGLLAKMPRLTIYTQDGRLKNAIDDIGHRLRQSKMVQRAFGGSSTPSIVLENCSSKYSSNSIHTETLPNPVTNPGIPGNDYKEKPDINISLWSRDDGFPALSEFSRILAKRAKAGMLKPRCIDEHLVAEELRDKAGHAHPDLMLLYSDLLCIPEFPPWQMQNTEVFQIGSEAKGLGDAVVRALTSYAKIEKRWGK
ncbi:hypothetical protein LPJ64_000780 [Coemansia asiatica]|uniref:ditrans,polycis-polyprenyl diphosphate synthase [(2E,6E)-farnesyldiphosphate specific] n=1 Tax=Coemansia asiatica TaxID=1052880 RepID=A0A9W7XRC7_9FUNG|nr:hypothetical protein LPJ64_000780 [Coemansia asiatica]